MSDESQPAFLVLTTDDIEELARWARVYARGGVSEYRLGNRLVVSKDEIVHIELEPRFSQDLLGEQIADAVARGSGEESGDWFDQHLRKSPTSPAVDRLILHAGQVTQAVEDLRSEWADGFTLEGRDSHDLVGAHHALQDAAEFLRGRMGPMITALKGKG